MEFGEKQSCDGFTLDTTSSSKIDFPCGDPESRRKAEHIEKPEKSEESDDPCANMVSTSSSSSTNTMLSQYFGSECHKRDHTRKEPPNIGYELNVAKAIMQQYSTISGDNLFDHLADIIKRVIDERPPNIIDFFEEFSRNVREQKLHLPERFPPDGVFEESRIYRVAKKFLLSMKLPVPEPHELQVADEMATVEESKSAILEGLKLDILDLSRFITFNERVQHLQFFWNQCGFGINSDDIFQLACAMDRLQTHPSIMQCRFWGMINGLKASYYIVEASLSHEEVLSRVDQMTEELQEKHKDLLSRLVSGTKPLPTFVGPELTPGKLGWDDHPIEEIEKMVPAAAPIPLAESKEVFNIPPETVGSGANRFSYFVVNSVSDDWMELPMVTPSQIQVSREIKKFLTGDLEAEIQSYPCFPGKEKHYLRALIARITAGTYIAPHGYYRTMTKKERRLYEGIEDDEEEEEEEPSLLGEGEEDIIADNDIMLLKNEKYVPESLESLTNLHKWLHVRPNLLRQGRVLWYDELKAHKTREKELERLRKLLRMEEMGEEEDDLDQEEEEEEDMEGEEFSVPEEGPPILHPCSNDLSDQFTMPWVTRFTSKYTNRNERILILQSNVWPGAYTFTFEKLCESIYVGWGHKYVARNMVLKHLPPVLEEYPHGEEDFIETTDPTPEEEEAYRLSLIKKVKKVNEEHLDEYDDELSPETNTEDEDEA
ncbi:radial spoke head protein 4 homolog A isoform X1 [Bactrocera dorsalis]|uniref:Radial spoke head protein 4 homolog A isoform X1 n=2 Tax=Bactrocera dorsalis TaxID=27457 RepID=A0A6I9V712_BACDO|nr:radial spoke head protein 4 homolog A isoform X1 [Bactrocera dorsalis]